MLEALPDCLSVCDGTLLLDKQSLIVLARQFQTPLFVFSQSQIETNIAKIKNAFQDYQKPLHLYYACKANSNRSILNIIHDAQVDLEINSAGELWKGLQTGFRGEQMLFNGVAKSNIELEQALSLDVTVTIDSLAELQRCLAIGERLGRLPSILLRVIPNVKSTILNAFQMGTANVKFGMEPSEAYRAIEMALSAAAPIQVGLHIHLGGQISEIAAFARVVDFVQEFISGYTHLRPNENWLPPLINLGGGLPCRFVHLPTTATQLTDEVHAMLNNTLDLEDLARELRRLNDAGYSLALEPGRFIVANTAVLLTQIVNEKQRQDGTHWLLLDAGSNVLMDTFIYSWFFEIASVDHITEAHRMAYSVGGPLCDAADVFQSAEGKGSLPMRRLLPAGTGMEDTLVFFDVGAYSLEQMNEYNGRLMPAVVLVHNQVARLIRRRQTFADLFHYDLE